MKDIVVNSTPTTVSRRNFLTGAGIAAAAVAATAVPAVAHAEEAPAAVADTAPEPVEDGVFKGVPLAIGHIVHDPDKCAGCRVCETVCSLSHFDTVSTALSNIVINTDWLGGYISEAQLCKQCPGANCVAACPTGAMHVDASTGARVVDADVCIGCKMCLEACPAAPSRVHFNKATETCFKCDLCGGEPQCVANCPMEALRASWVEEEADPNTYVTDEGITVHVALTGSIPIVAPDAITLNETTVFRTANGVTVQGSATNGYTQPCPAKVQITFYDEEKEVLDFADRLELTIEIGETGPYEYVFETAEPDKVAMVYVEFMAGKISG